MTEPEPAKPESRPPPRSLLRQVRHLRYGPDGAEMEVLPGDDYEITETEGQALRLRGGHGIERTPKSLPVLRAFQDFLEAERRRSRNRILFLTAFFAAVLISVVSIGLFVGMAFMGQVRGDVDGMRVDLTDARETAATVRQEARSAMAAMARDAVARRTEAQADRSELAAAAGAMEAGLAACSNRLTDLKGLLDSLKADNAELKGDIADARRTLREAADRAAQPSGVALPLASPTGAVQAVLTVNITPRGSDRPARWLIPLSR
jgi:hypothetical protein